MSGRARGARALVPSLAPLCAVAAACSPTTVVPGGDGGGDYESGCIAVASTTRTFAHLADALEVAEPGDVVELCAGVFPGAAIVDKPVTIRGAGADATAVSWQDRGPAMVIRQTEGVLVEDLSVSGWEEGIAIQGASGVTLARVRVEATGGAGVRASGSGVLLDGVTVREAGGGGVVADAGSDLVVQGGLLSANVGYGVFAGESSLSVAATTVEGTRFDEDEREGGVGIYVESPTAPVSLTDVVATDNEVAGILWYYAAVDVLRATVSGGASGIYGVFDGPSTVTDTDVGGVSAAGIYLMAQDATVTGTRVACSGLLDDQIGIALSSADGTIEVRAADVSSCRGVGIAIQRDWNDGYPSTGGTATVASSRVHDLLGIGLDVRDVDVAVIEDNALEGIRWSGAVTDDYADGWGAVLTDVADARLARNTFRDNEIYGLVAVGGSLASASDTFTGNQWSAVRLAGASAVLSGPSVTDNGNYGLWADEGSDMRVEDGLIARTTMVFRPEDRELPPQDPEFALWGGHGLRVSESRAVLARCAIEDAEDYGLYGTDSDVAVEDSTVDRCGEGGLYVNGYAMTVRRTTVRDIGQYGLRAISSSSVFDDVTVERAGLGTSGGYGIYSYYGALSLLGGRLDDNDRNAYVAVQISSQEAPTPFLIEGTEFGSSTQTSLTVRGGAGPDAVLRGATFECTARCLDTSDFFGTVEGCSFTGPEHGLYFAASNQENAGGPLTIRGNTFAALGTTAIYSRGFVGEVVVEGNDVQGTGQEGIRISTLTGRSMAVTLRDNAVAGAGSGGSYDSVYVSAYGGTGSLRVEGTNVFQGGTGDGLEARWLDVSVEGGSLTGNSLRGMYVYNSSIDLGAGLELSGNGSDGIYLNGTVTGDIAGNDISGNGGRGIYCYGETVQIGECHNAMGDNAMGDFYAAGGCSLPCTVDP